jgi:hypothetical protein
MMPNLIESIKDLFAQKEPLPAGMYTYQTPPEAEKQHRLHLRVESDGSGLLVIDASTVLHLNQTAVEFAYHYIEHTDTELAIQEISQRYRMDREHIRQDYESFMDRIQTLVDTPDLDPVTYLDIERQEPYTADISAPYRLDCAITYQVPEESHREHAPLDRVNRELSTEEWVSIFQKAFDQGIPHILFTGGEPTLREDLPELILKAEEIGLVTGLLTDGLKMDEDTYRSKLLMNGLDHLMIVFDPINPKEWEVLKKVLADDLHTTVHLTLRKGDDLHLHMQRMAEMGVHAISLSEADRDLTDELQDLRDFAAVLQMDLVWDMPVPYSEYNPVSLELEKTAGVEVPEGAGKAWLYVEPDGDVLPAQGYYDRVLGNLLDDPWDKIWENR